MIRGLVIGKFMPVHEGHLQLIRFAAAKCDQLTVSMSHRPSDPIAGELRFRWLNECIGDIPGNITTNLIIDDFDDESLDWSQRTRIWAPKLRKLYGRIDRIFSSEHYGNHLAANLGAEHLEFDRDRRRVPVSASAIRRNPFTYWEFIPPAVRPFFVKKVCFYGPESTGKSFMAQKLAGVYNTKFVPEVAREMLTNNAFNVYDIVRIGQAQLARVRLKLQSANKILICDTDLITTQIYSKIYLGTVPEVLYQLEKEIRYDQYFLFNIDVPWVKDGLRDLGERRQEVYGMFEGELVKRQIPYVTVSGNYEQREAMLKKEIDAILENA